MKIRTFSVLILAALAVLPVHSGETPGKRNCVRFVYLNSADREFDPAYFKAVKRAALDIQAWYKSQMGGRTFDLCKGTPEALKSRRQASYFSNNPNGERSDDWGFYNTFYEMRDLRKADPSKDGYVWVIYSDGPGNKGRANPGFAYLPEDDLLGLVGKHPEQKNPVRWLGGLGHELGHALGLAHPQDTENAGGAIMWAGFYSPKSSWLLTPEDKNILRRSPFIRGPARKGGILRTQVR